MMGGIEAAPGEEYYQVTKGSPPAIAANGPIGTNNIVSAKAAMNSWVIKQSRVPEMEETAYFGFEEKIQEAYKKKFGDGKGLGKDINLELHLFTFRGLIEAVVIDI